MGKKVHKAGSAFPPLGNTNVHNACLMTGHDLQPHKCKCLYIAKSIREYGQRSPETSSHIK